MGKIDSKTIILDFIQRNQWIQAFDAALAAHLDETIPEYQRGNDYKRLVQQLLLATGGIPWDGLNTDTFLVEDCHDYLSNPEQFSNREAVVACLLKLIADRRVDWIRSGKWRPKVVGYLSKSVDKNAFLKFRKVNFEEQNHLVIDALAIAVNEAIGNVRQAIEDLTSLSRLSAHRAKFLEYIRRPDGLSIFGPFLPPNSLSQTAETYDRFMEYLEQRDGPNAIDSYERAIKWAERLSSDFQNFNTEYGKLLATTLGTKLSTLLKEDFAQNKASKPAEVIVVARDKKYPFHTTGQEIHLSLSVTNHGPGYANGTTLTILTEDCLEILDDCGYTTPGRLRPAEQHYVNALVRVKSPVQSTTIACEVAWKDFDRSEKKCTFYLNLAAQNADINWINLAKQNPYSLEPVQTEEDLVGRKDALDKLISTFDSRTVGSAIVRGQKRVGKTSIAKTLGNELKNRGFLVIYVEQGDYIDPDPRRTVAKLGELLCKRLRREETRLRQMTPPNFSDALAPLADFLDDAMEILGDKRIVFILDEFDELPPDLYRIDELGNALFLTLRSISARDPIGFLLVGGEKMAHITKYQGSKLNKWKDEQVDYFSRETEWQDYRNLVTKPVYNSLEYSERALEQLYRYSAGNPYFTKLLCADILRAALERHDCYITEDEVEKAVDKAAQEVSEYTFQHFWDDGIIDKGEVREAKVMRRQKILIATARISEVSQCATLDAIKDDAMLREVAFVENEIREFVNRKILKEVSTNAFKLTVKLFIQWLKRNGINELMSKFPDPSLSIQGIQAQELLRISPNEIVKLVERWGTYKGQHVTTDKVRAWLEQFGGPREQRLMFKLLQGVTFYTQSALRGKMKEVHEIVRQGLSRNLGKDKKLTKYSEILVGYLDGPDKSGAKFARLYADVAEVYVHRVVEKSDIVRQLEKDADIQVLVFVDDFVGTGNSANGYLRDLCNQLEPVLAERNQSLKIVFTSVVAYSQGWATVQQTVKSLPLEVTIHACEMLDESYSCFSESSRIFTDPVEREEAKELALNFGRKLEKNTPCGFGGLELAVVFEDNCPNNTLPILRAESGGKNAWRPLFRRS